MYLLQLLFNIFLGELGPPSWRHRTWMSSRPVRLRRDIRARGKTRVDRSPQGTDAEAPNGIYRPPLTQSFLSLFRPPRSQSMAQTHHFDAMYVPLGFLKACTLTDGSLFDMDGTLVNSTAGVVGAWEVFAQSYPGLDVHNILSCEWERLWTSLFAATCTS